MCRAAETTKAGFSVLDGVSASILINNKKRSRKPTEFKKQVSDKQKHKQYKYCGKYNEMKWSVQLTEKRAESVETILKVSALHLPNMAQPSRGKLTQWI